MLKYFWLLPQKALSIGLLVFGRPLGRALGTMCRLSVLSSSVTHVGLLS